MATTLMLIISLMVIDVGSDDTDHNSTGYGYQDVEADSAADDDDDGCDLDDDESSDETHCHQTAYAWPRHGRANWFMHSQVSAKRIKRGSGYRGQLSEVSASRCYSGQ